jgi:hypothetical protein
VARLSPLRYAALVDEADGDAFTAKNPIAATRLYHLALLYERQSNYTQAKPLLPRTLAVREQVFRLEYTAVAEASSCSEISRSPKEKRRNSEAFFRRVLAIGERSLGPDHLIVVIALCYCSFIPLA